MSKFPLSSLSIKRLVYAALCLAIALVLPFLTGGIPQVGGMLCPMHLPVLLCGLLCGPFWGAAVGLVCPLLRHMLFSMPPLLTAITMTFELAAYGFFSGFFWRVLSKMFPTHKMVALYSALLLSMLAGRLVWGLSSALLMLAGRTSFSWQVFWVSGFVSAWPGMVLQLVVIPAIWRGVEKSKR